MASQTNKVRYGLSRVHYAIYDEDQHTYGTPQPLAGATNLEFTPEGSQNQFYADNVIYFTSNPQASETGTLTLADMTDQAKIDILGYKSDATSGVIYEATTTTYPTIALLYQVEGDGNVLRGVRYNVKMARSNETYGTTSDSVEPNTQEFSFTATGRDFTVGNETVNVLKSHCTNAGEEHDAFDAWFESVVVPGAAVGTTGVTTLSALTVGTLTLTPTFKAGTNVYTASAPNATSSAAVTATATDNEATVSITCNGDAVTSGGNASLSVGSNVITVVVTNGGATGVYTVVVTRAAS